MKFSREVFFKDPNICCNNLTGMHLIYLTPVCMCHLPRSCLSVTAGYHHVNYFKGVDAREKYNTFFKKVLKVKDVAIATFADLDQCLLVDYIRDVLLQPEAAECFRTWWAGARDRYCLAHAGYGGSNNNMGVEVDWRDVKG